MLRKIQLGAHYASAKLAVHLGLASGVCVLCGSRVGRFLPWRGGWKSAPDLMVALGVVGSDLDRFACPSCGSTDRERHLRLYFERVGLDRTVSGGRVLHFAPEPRFASWVRSLGPAQYIQADLAPSSDDVAYADIQCLDFDNECFDMVIANHVLEHVADLDAALSEIGRVLRADGVAILQTPWCSGISKTIEDPAVVDKRARRALFGQEDHVRLFGADVFRQISRHGLVAEIGYHENLMPDIDSMRVGVNPSEPLMRFIKR